MTRRSPRRLAGQLLLSMLTAPAWAAPAGEVPAPATPGPTPPVADAGVDDQLAGELQSAMARLARQTKSAAMAKLDARDYPGALQDLARAYAIDPDDLEVNHQLGRLYSLLGQRAEAERYLRRAVALDSDGAIAHGALADLLSEPPTTEPALTEAARLLRSARLRLGRDATIVIRQARVAAARGHFEEATRFYADYQSLGAALDDALRLELGDFHRDQGHKEEALGYYRQVGGQDANSQRQAAQRIFELSAQREAEHLGLAIQSPQLLRRVRQQVGQARMLIAEGQLKRAETLLTAVIRDAPLFAPGRAALADVAVALGRQGAAEQDYLRAIVLGAGEGQTYASLGSLYAHWQPQPRYAEATVMLQRALQSRPDLVTLHRLLADCLRAIGDLPRALMHARAYLKGSFDENARQRARRLIAELERVVGGGSEAVLDILGSAPSTATALARARAHLGSGATDAALAELRGIVVQNQNVEVLNLEARILIAAGRTDEARAALLRSLQREPTQAAIHTTLGQLLVRNGEPELALTHLRHAERLGDADALIEVIVLHAGPPAIWLDITRLPELRRLRQRLDDPRFAHADGATKSRRAKLAARLDSRLIDSVLAALGILALVSGSLLLWRRRRSGGVGLAALTSLHPETGPQVQRVLLSLRHEVLKHNTTMLTGLIESLQRAEPDTELAAHLSRALFGTGSSAADRAEGALQKLETYTSQLEQLGRSHGLRINLQRRDPALSQILSGFARLRGIRPRLIALGEGDTSGQRRLLSVLRQANAEINERGYAELQSLLDQLQVFHADEEGLRAIFDAVCREPSIAALSVAELQLDVQPGVLPCPLMIARHDFDDVLTNLLRNAIQATAVAHANGDKAIAIGLQVEIDVDDITGLAQAKLRIKDSSTKELTTETLRHQVIERGLGLTADRVNRYDGSLDVEPLDDGPWTKAVVLTLPVAL